MLSSMTALISASIVFLAWTRRTFRERMAGPPAHGGADHQLQQRLAAPLQRQRRGGGDARRAPGRERRSWPPASSGPARTVPSPSTPRATAAGLCSARPAALRRSATLFDSDHLSCWSPFSFDGKRSGRSSSRPSSGELRPRQRRYAGIVLVVLAGLLPARPRHLATVERTISGPILDLAARGPRGLHAQGLLRARRRPGQRRGRGRWSRPSTRCSTRSRARNLELERGARRSGDGGWRRARATSPPPTRSSRPSPTPCPTTCAPPCARSTGSARCCSRATPAALDDRGRHYLDRVRAATQRMSELIDDLLALARVSRKELVRREVDVSALAGRVAAELARREPARASRRSRSPAGWPPRPTRSS